MKSKENQRLQIAIGLPDNITEIISSKYNLSQKENISHLTLYGTEFPLNNMQKIISCVENIATKVKRFRITIGELTADKGYWLWKISKGKNKIMKIHIDVINKLNPLRGEVLRSKFLNPVFLKSIPNEQADLAVKYGSQWVMNYFLPHITLEKNELKILPVDYLKGVKFVANNISIYKAGEHATCKELIRSFSLL